MVAAVHFISTLGGKNNALKLYCFALEQKVYKVIRESGF